MDNLLLKQFAKHIVSKGSIKQGESQKIMKMLKPQDLRKLVQLILLEEQKETAYITTADELTRQNKSEIASLFKGKKVVASTNKQVGAGIRAQVYDMIYDLTIKSKIETMATELEEEL